ncbi:FtsX-like permease family protein [Desulfocurvus sp.]|jgi:cell division transport system permease protein|uniref:cell division protein FtsX n=1 Tax=Desulfocurvus sp. TaxID=2871698 RepID=UPI0025B92ED9|nr:FtsX-like permease family protein [Desulfocurvus sp.]
MIARMARLLLRGVADLGRNPLAQALTLCAVTLTAFLAGLFLLLLVNLNQALLSAGGDFVFQVYWAPGTPEDALRDQWARLDALPGFQAKTTYTPAQALDELGLALGGEAKAIGGLTGGALPPTAVVSLRAPEADPAVFVQQTLSALQGLPGVADIHYSALQVDLARSWQRFARTVLWPLIGLLGFTAALVVGNTVRLSLAGRRDEVDILRLVGAGRWYIQLPLLVGGAVQGLAGGALALGLLALAHLALADLAATPPLNMTFAFLPLGHCLALAGGMALAGALASLVALRE